MRLVTLKHGRKMFVHDKGEYIADYVFQKKQYFEQKALIFFAKKFSLSSIIDIGANLGNHAKFFVDELGLNVYAFEPCKRNYNLLKLNAPKAVCFNLALSNEPRSFQAHHLQLLSRNNTLQDIWTNTPLWGDGISEEDVAVLTLDHFHFPSIDAIKIDVEGSELRVLHGAVATIKIHAPVIWIELHKDQALVDGGFEYRRSDVFSFLRSLGYFPYSRDNAGNHIFLPKSKNVLRHIHSSIDT